MKGVLIVSVLCLAIGLGVIFGYCNGTTGLAFAYPLTGCSIHIDITTTGAGVMGGVGFTLLGAVLLLIAFLIALFGLFRRKEATTPLPRREEPFEG